MTSLRVFDPLYGEIKLPSVVEPFLNLPEFRRLASVRLLNFDSIELAALSEARRLSHTLGVLYLWTRLRNVFFGSCELDALAVAIVLHDIGTPPFGHTMEYEFVRKFGKSHENIILDIIRGEHHITNVDHQIYRSRQVGLNKMMTKSKLATLACEILAGNNPLCAYVFGTIDLDNIDNVFRMSHYLGDSGGAVIADRIAEHLIVDRSRTLWFPKAEAAALNEWLRRRRSSYERILLSREHRTRQAIFEQLVYEAMALGSVTISDWFLTDEQLYERLRRDRRVEPLLFELNRPTDELRRMHVKVVAADRLDRVTLLSLRDALRERLATSVGPRAYVSFAPLGETLARRLTLKDPRDSETWTIGDPELTYSLFVAWVGTDRARAKAAAEVVLGFIDENSWNVDGHARGDAETSGGFVELPRH